MSSSSAPRRVENSVAYWANKIKSVQTHNDALQIIKPNVGSSNLQAAADDWQESITRMYDECVRILDEYEAKRSEISPEVKTALHPLMVELRAIRLHAADHIKVRPSAAYRRV
jgi:hypothetical protein